MKVRSLTTIVVTHESAAVLPTLLRALPEAVEGAPRHHLVVVDNDSSDETLEVVAELAPDATVVRTGRNAGYAAGFNAGVAAAPDDTDAFLLLNPDVSPHRGSIAELCGALEARPGAGVVVPRLLESDGTTARSLRRRPTLLRAFGEAVLGGRLAGRFAALGEVVRDPAAYERPHAVDWASGAAMLIARTCLEAAGSWDESFFLYSEETEFAERARREGFRVWYEPRAVMTHIGGDAPRSPYLWSILSRNRARAYGRTHGSAATRLYWTAVVLNEALRAATGSAVHRAALRDLVAEGPPRTAAAPRLDRRRSRGRRRPAKPRVCIVVQNLPVPLDRRVWLQAQALQREGIDVSVISPMGPGDPSYEELEGVHLYKYRPPPAATGALSYAWEFAYCWLQTARLVLRVLQGGRIDVLQACNPPDTYFLLGALLRPLGTRFLFDQHDLCPEVYQSRFGRRGPLHRALLALERATYRTADHVLSTNQSYRDVAMRRGGVSSERVTVVRNGPDLRRLFPREPRPPLRQGARHLCVYLGIMGPQDGVDVVLRAADHIVHNLGRTDVRFALLGFGDCYDDLVQLAHELDLDGHVVFTGRADDTMISDYLSTADVGLSPDPKDDFNDISTMNKTMEYMAFGLPVVAFDLHETRVSAEDAAVYVATDDVVDYAKAIVALLDDPRARAEMGAAGLERVRRRLAWQHQEAIYVEAVKALTMSGATQR